MFQKQNGMRPCPMAAMDIILHLMPLHVVLETALTSACSQMAKIGLGRSPVMMKEVVNCWKLQRDSMIRRYNFKLNIKSEWSKESNNSLAKYTIVWYPDWAKTEEGIGTRVF